MVNMYQQDFDTIVIGKHKNMTSSGKTAVTSKRTQDSAVQFKLDTTDMGGDSFEKAHKQTTDMHKKFRDKMIASRANRHMSQQEFANFLNIKKDVVQKVESGTFKLDPAIIQKIQRRL